jgi:hypothetical protein
MEEFLSFPKMGRFSREVVVTEKIDGSNAQVFIAEMEGHVPDGCVAVVGGLAIFAGSRSRWITPSEDNFGFASWVKQNAECLAELGPGRHFGEWWGSGIQRRYGLTEKRFSLFNTHRWGESRPACCHVVPVLWRGQFDDFDAELEIKKLLANGSVAAPGFGNPEVIVIYHTAAGVGFKKTIDKDDEPKSLHGRFKS